MPSSVAGAVKYDNAAQASSKVLGSPWRFTKHGRSGLDVSELLPHTARLADDLCVVRSMHTGVNNHVQGIHALNTGRIVSGSMTRPSSVLIIDSPSAPASTWAAGPT